MEIKKCLKCLRELPLQDFYFDKQWGFTSPCKFCRLSYAASYRAQHRSKINIKTRKWRAVNRQKAAALIKSWESRHPREAGRRTAKYGKKIHGTPRWFAGRAVINARRRGDIQPSPCRICGATKVHAHHHSYRPERCLDVTWLCPTHHRAWHRIFVAEAAGQTGDSSSD